jgi:hypothetical protein
MIVRASTRYHVSTFLSSGRQYHLHSRNGVQRLVEDGRKLEEIPNQDDAKATKKLVAVLRENFT